MIRFKPKEMSVPDVQRLMQGGIAPRPIAFVSTISADGIPNLAPFSFFNAFSSNPPIVVFSPSRSGKTNTTKDTYNNLMEVGECVIHAVTYDIMYQMNLASFEFAPDENEFEMAGFTPIKSELVKPFRVKESPFQMECKLRHMFSMGDGPSAGNLAVCEVILFHVDESIMKDGSIDPFLIDHIGRNGKSWYTRAQGKALFELHKPSDKRPVGYPALPERVKISTVLSANDIGKLASSLNIPDRNDAIRFAEALNPLEAAKTDFDRYAVAGNFHDMFRIALFYKSNNHEYADYMLEMTAKKAISSDAIEIAWYAILLMD
jgi:flavin reductase (DIM6/NTAB) family NADH-FMN oxidoreductase RutF